MAAAAGKINEVRELIVAGRYNEARKILKTTTHPKTDEWLVRLETLARAKTQPGKNRRDLQEMNAVTGKTRSSQTQIMTRVPTTRPAEPKFREKALYKDDLFTITRQHLMIQDAIYPLCQMDDVQVYESEQPDDTGMVIFRGVVCLAVCIIAVLFFYNKPVLNLLAIIGGVGAFSIICWLIWKLLPSQTPRNYTLRITFGLVKEDVYVAQDKGYIASIVYQLNNTRAQSTQPSRKTMR